MPLRLTARRGVRQRPRQVSTGVIHAWLDAARRRGTGEVFVLQTAQRSSVQLFSVPMSRNAASRACSVQLPLAASDERSHVYASLMLSAEPPGLI